MLLLLLGNFALMAFDAREANTQQRVIRVWTQTTADFIQSPVTFISSAVTNYFSSISSMRTAQSENDALKQRIQELEVEVQDSKSLTFENERLKSLLELKSETAYRFLPAQIIGRDTETGLPVVVSDDPLSSVVLGTGKMLSDFELLKRVKWDNTMMTGG